MIRSFLRGVGSILNIAGTRLSVDEQLADLDRQLDELKRVERLALTRCQRERADRGGA